MSKPDTLKAKVKTARLQMEFSGTLDEGIVELFSMVIPTERRVALLEKLKESHDHMEAFIESTGVPA